MIHVHPFPARMAPEIVLKKIADLPAGSTVLDPMAGSGMVLSQCVRAGHKALGGDLDPLARLISKVGSSRVSEDLVRTRAAELVSLCRRKEGKKFKLTWIDADPETDDFINYWFASRQRDELRAMAFFLVEQPFCRNDKVLNLLKVAVSRLIITKEPKASLARDTAHSRPHRTIEENDFGVIDAFLPSVEHVLRALDGTGIQNDAKVYKLDSRRMPRIKDEEIDVLITSPPYLNAIDYMRGHKLSLVWLGHTISSLRMIRATSIGAERKFDGRELQGFDRLFEKIELSAMAPKQYGLLKRYYFDLLSHLKETERVLRAGGAALYVIGNSSVRGQYVRNNEILKFCATEAGLSFNSESEREIPAAKRYLPVSVGNGNALSRRMRTEHIIEFSKA